MENKEAFIQVEVERREGFRLGKDISPLLPRLRKKMLKQTF